MIDVVIPVYNGSRFLDRAVASVLAQTVPVEDVIIVDDGSNDATPDVARRFEDEHAAVLYVRTAHRGVSAARNTGIRLSSAPLLAFLDADDVWLPHKLAKQLEVLSGTTPDVGLVHSSYQHIDEQGRVVASARVVPPTQRGDLLAPLLFEDYVLSGSASSALVRRQCLDRAGWFDERLSHGEDWDLWLRLAAICRFDYCPDVLVQVRIHPGSAQRTVAPDRALGFALQRMLVYQKWADRVPEFRERRGEMRSQVATMLLVEAVRRPWIVERFYRRAREQGDVLFEGRVALWRALVRQAVLLGLPGIALRRLLRMLRQRV